MKYYTALILLGWTLLVGVSIGKENGSWMIHTPGAYPFWLLVVLTVPVVLYYAHDRFYPTGIRRTNTGFEPTPKEKAEEYDRQALVGMSQATRAQYYRTAGGTREYRLMGYERGYDGEWREYVGG